MSMSRRCIPYTPRRRELREMTLALVTTAGVHPRGQEPFDLDGDNSWRLIPGDAATADLMVTHEHYDHRHADADVNCVFPLDRLRELAAEGVIAGVGDKHLGFMGYTQQLRDLYERAAPEMARIIERSQADAVLLTAGCPLCHRTVVAIQREIEMRGVPTVLITLVPDASQEMGPPRALAPRGFLWATCWGCHTSQSCNAACSWTRCADWRRARSRELSGSLNTLITSPIPRSSTTARSFTTETAREGCARRRAVESMAPLARWCRAAGRQCAHARDGRAGNRYA